MPYQMDWLIEGEVIYNRNWGVGTGDEIREAMRESRRLIDLSDRPFVHMLIDNRGTTESPKLAESAKAVRGEPGHVRAGWLVSVHTSNSIVRFLSDIAIQMTGMRFRSFKTMEEAITFLRAVDDTVSWDKLPEPFKA